MFSAMFIGRIGQFQYYPEKEGKKAFASFSLALQQGQGEEPVWVSVKAFGKIADLIGNYASKGRLIAVHATAVQVDQYGKTVSLECEGVGQIEAEIPQQRLVFIASSVRFLDAPKKEEQSGTAVKAKVVVAAAKAANKAEEEGGDDDLPF